MIRKILDSDKLNTGWRAKYNETVDEIITSVNDLGTGIVEFVKNGGSKISLTFTSFFTKTEVTNLLNNKVDKNGTDRLMTASEGTKLAGINEHYRGTYTSLVNLQTAIPTGNEGNEAVVDAGVGSDPKKYIWDISDSAWKLGSGTSVTVDQSINQGSTNAVSGGAVYNGLVGKEDASNKGAANGYASLGSDGKVPSSQLPTSSTDFTDSQNILINQIFS